MRENMTGIFLTVLSMSVTASFVIAAVVPLRFLMKKMPGIFSYCLWLVVFVRLLFPFSLEAGWGFVPSASFTGMNGESTDVGAAAEDGAVLERYVSGKQGTLDEAGAFAKNAPEGGHGAENIAGAKGGNPDAAGRLMWVWAAGCLLLLFHGIFSYIRFMKILKADGKGEKERIADGKYVIVISEDVKAPFVAGLIKPVIYLPRGLDRVQCDMVCEHEKMHIVRRDYLVKPAAYLAVCLHWFNPLVWLAFRLMEQDMEISCDEAVLEKEGEDNGKIYARTLLLLSQEYRWKAGSPIAFGENSVKARIKNAVRYKRVKLWVLVAGTAGVLLAAVLLFVNSRWKVVISFVDAGKTQEKEAFTDGLGAPGTDSNMETEYQYFDNAKETDNPMADETVYLPAEKIVHTESIFRDEDGTPVTEDHYYTGNSSVSGSEGGDENLQGQADSKEEPGKNEDEAEDDYAVLLRLSEGISEMSALKYAYPLEYDRISDDYGVRTNPITQIKRIHSGVDFAAEEGTPVKAAAAGIVFETGADVKCGNYVIIRHTNGDMTYYANCGEILAQTGAEVAQGEQIATVGSTGMSTGCHLHYALSRNGEFVRPEFFE